MHSKTDAYVLTYDHTCAIMQFIIEEIPWYVPLIASEGSIMNTKFENAAKTVEQQAAQLRQEREAHNEQLRLERQRLADEQAADAEKARQDAQKARELAVLIENVRTFIDGFENAVLKAADMYEWNPEEILAAGNYVAQLVFPNDRELPRVPAKVAHVVHDKFAYGIALCGNIPDGTLIGQRQDWFPALYQQDVEQIEKRRSERQTSAPSQPASQEVVSSKPSLLFYSTASAGMRLKH